MQKGVGCKQKIKKMTWNNLTEAEWNEFAKHWLIDMTKDESNSEYSQSLLMLNFMGSSEANWKFIQVALNHAISDEELGHLAAGPLEHFISKHGKEYIIQIEEFANTNSKFNRLLTGVWKHLADDEIWNRIKVLQKKVVNPLPEYSNE